MGLKSEPPESRGVSSRPVQTPHRHLIAGHDHDDRDDKIAADVVNDAAGLSLQIKTNLRLCGRRTWEKISKKRVTFDLKRSESLNNNNNNSNDNNIHISSTSCDGQQQQQHSNSSQQILHDFRNKFSSVQLQDGLIGKAESNGNVSATTSSSSSSSLPSSSSSSSSTSLSTSLVVPSSRIDQSRPRQVNIDNNSKDTTSNDNDDINNNNNSNNKPPTLLHSQTLRNDEKPSNITTNNSDQIPFAPNPPDINPTEFVPEVPNPPAARKFPDTTTAGQLGPPCRTAYISSGYSSTKSHRRKASLGTKDFATVFPNLVADNFEYRCRAIA